jgi:hypothetical protein
MRYQVSRSYLRGRALGVTLGRIALLRISVLAGRRAVAGLLVTIFDAHQNPNSPKKYPSTSRSHLPHALRHRGDPAVV